MSVLRLLAGIFGGGIPDQLRRAYEAKLAAGNDADRIAAEVEIARLQNRLATSDNPVLRLAIGIIALAMALHRPRAARPDERLAGQHHPVLLRAFGPQQTLPLKGTSNGAQ